MAIGTLAAVAIGAGALGSAAISKSASNKAANAATQAADQSAQVQREQLQAAQNALSPFVQAGTPATARINALLGLGGSQQVANPAYDPNNPYQYDWQTGQYTQVPQYITQQADSAEAARQGFEQFRNSTGYDFRVKEGMRALNSGYAGAGTLQSGAAIKGAVDYGQGMASQEFGNYLGALGNQQGLGLSAGSALAGVGQNYANSLGNIYSNKADAIGNSALLNAANTNSMIGGLTSGIFKYGMK